MSADGHLVRILTFIWTLKTFETVLMKIILNDFVKACSLKGKYVNDYHGFEQVLHDKFSTRKMDVDA